MTIKTRNLARFIVLGLALTGVLIAAMIVQPAWSSGSANATSHRAPTGHLAASNMHDANLRQRAGVNLGSARQVGQQDDTTFFIADGTHNANERCFIVAHGAGAATSPGITACGDANKISFPPQVPLLNLSTFAVTQGSGEYPMLTRLQGFAGEGVAAVGVVDVNGAVHRTPVIGNVYAKRNPVKAPVTALLALSRSGKTLYTIAIGVGD
jgi:hypothetical protein